MQSANLILLCALCGHIAAQSLKIFFRLLRGSFTARSLVQDGGMPSAHTATVIAMTWGVYRLEGLSTAFAVAAIFSAIVIIDALHIRSEVGRHAEALNAILKRKEFKEDTGHTVYEVFAGAVVGIVTATLIL